MAKDFTADLISIPKAAMMLGLSIPYTQRLIRSGKVEGQRIGRDWFTTEKAIEAYVQSRRRSGRRKRWEDF